jgi:arylsulfatase A-like enzyme
MSDNGGLSAHGRGGTPHSHNAPLSSGKGSAREGGVRVPMIVAWPGVTEGGTECRQTVIIEDFFPSILEMAGIDQPRQVGGIIDGRSFLPWLRNGFSEPIEERALYWHFPNCWGPNGPGIGASSAMRLGRWKLIYDHADQSYELFDLDEDIGEQNNLSASNPGMRDQLARKLGAYLKSVNAQMPTDKTTGERVPYPGLR